MQGRGITYLFPVQAATFDLIYNKTDVIARDLTGTGKTLAFCLPLVERLRKDGLLGPDPQSNARKWKAIILAPTRELALQVSKELEALKHHRNEFKVSTIYGGVSIENQQYELLRGVDFVVGTTGRILDHLNRGNADFSNIQTIILDEADRMLDMGFQEDIEKIMTEIKQQNLMSKTQFILFSATVPVWVRNVARKYLDSGHKIVNLVKDLKNKTAKDVEHLALKHNVNDKISLLSDILMCYGSFSNKTIIFTGTKAEANEIMMSPKLKDNVEVLHGDITQHRREVSLKRFREGKCNVLVATDVASRGLDIPNVDLVIQLEPPKEIESYIHRSGRTARAGNQGTCITFYQRYDKETMNRIENKAGIRFKIIGSPQPEDIIKSSAKSINKELDKVNTDVLPYFKEAATKLILDKGALNAVSLALAYISGATEKLKPRSLLSGDEDMVTLQISLER